MSEIFIDIEAKDIKGIFLHRDELEKELRSRGIERVDKFIDLAVKAYKLLESFDLEDENFMAQAELIVKSDFVEFNDNLFLAFDEIMNCADRGALEKIIAPYTLEEILEVSSIDTNHKLANKGPKKESEEAFIVNSVFTFFRHSVIYDVYSHINSIEHPEQTALQAIQQLLDSAIRWSVLGLIILACGKEEDIIDVAETCIARATGYADSVFIMEPIYEQLDDTGELIGPLKAQKPSAEKGHSNVYTTEMGQLAKDTLIKFSKSPDTVGYKPAGVAAWKFAKNNPPTFMGTTATFPDDHTIEYDGTKRTKKAFLNAIDRQAKK